MYVTVNNKISTGKSGEFFVAGELERRGFSCALTYANTKDFDILAINRANYKQIGIQVKTMHSKDKYWMLSEKCEKVNKDDIFYIFVSLHELGNPEYHIVPSAIVAKEITEEHKKWLETPGKKGQPHKDNNRRMFYDKDDRFLDNWDCLK